MPVGLIATTHIAILGGGLAGLGCGAQLRAHGITDFLILEQADHIGGTWRDNTYPGCACDTESHLYCFSFAPNPSVSRLYARQPELLAYAERIAEHAGLTPHLRLGCTVRAARFVESDARWIITLTDGRQISARHVVTAWGQLNRPSIPAIRGADDFAGDAFHSARWRHDIALQGRRVASIGNAASAVQYVPEVAPLAGHLDVFQRSPNWVVPRGDRPYTPRELALYQADPECFAQSRQQLFDWRESQFERMRVGSGEATELGAVALAHLAAQVPDGQLRARLTPDYAPGCKRILRSDDYYPALMRQNVALVTEAIDRVVPAGIVTSDQVLHPADVIIYGTGFETHSFQGEIDIVGLGGQTLRARWADYAEAFKGVSIDPFPNFHMLYGPNTNLGHNSVLSMIEAQIDYVIQLIGLSDAAPTRSLVVRKDRVADYNAGLQAEFVGSAWGSDCTSWYKTATGRVVNNWSGTVRDYQETTSQVRPDDYRTL